MMKYLSRRKAAKGFTMVELIVVVGIIGVLAAILIPTMMGFTMSAQITSANSTAGEIKNSIDTFLTKVDTEDDYGMLLGDSNREVLTIEVKNYQWTVYAVTNTDAFKSGGSLEWGTDGTADKDSNTVEAASPEAVLAKRFASLFPEMENAVIKANCIGGKCISLWYTADASSADDVAGVPVFGTSSTEPWVDDEGNVTTTFVWNNNNAGVTVDGLIVGTAPQLALG